MSGKVKATAVIEATLTRIETSEPTVNAFTDVVAERARKRAAEIDAGTHRGPLAGVPFAVKNLFDIKGLPTRAGSKINVDGPIGRARRLAGAQARGGRCDPRRRPQHGRVRLRLHRRERPLRTVAAIRATRRA